MQTVAAIMARVRSPSQSPDTRSECGLFPRTLVALNLEHPLPGNPLLNVNIPNLPYEQIGEWQVTRLGKRHPSQPVIPQTNPRGEPIYWIGPSGSARDASEGTDFHAVANGHVSITPLQLDLTHTAMLPATREWLRAGSGAS